MPLRANAAPVTLTTGPLRRTLFFLALPVLGEQLLNTLVGIFDTYLAGRISSSATAAVGMGAYVSWLASMIVMLVGIGTTALVSRHVGAGDENEANRFANQSLTLSGGLGILLFAALFTLAPWLARYANMTGEAYHITVHYLRIDACGHLAMSITLVGCAAMRGAGDMRTPMMIFAFVNAVNVLASCVMVFGLGPVPRLGVTGIVCGTLIARCLGACLTLAILARATGAVHLRLSRLAFDRACARRILRIGGPAAADGVVIWGGHFALLAVIARLAPPPWGQAMFAAHIIAVRVEALTYLPAVAWASAVATMIGQSLGAGDAQRARRAGHEAVLQCGMLSVVIAVFFFFGSEQIYGWMSDDPVVRAAGAGPFRMLAVLQPCLAISIVYIGGLRGAGDTRVPLAISLLGATLIRVPLGYYFGIVVGAGLTGAWIGMCADMIWRATAATIRFRGGRWMGTEV